MDDPSFYGFPLFGEPAVKVTQDAGGKTVDADTRTFEPDLEIVARTRAFLAEHLPTALGPEHLVKTCLYTLTPDRDFVIDTLPSHPKCQSPSAPATRSSSLPQSDDCSQGSRLKTQLRSSERFAVDRPILKMSNPPRTYMV